MSDLFRVEVAAPFAGCRGPSGDSGRLVEHRVGPQVSGSVAALGATAIAATVQALACLSFVDLQRSSAEARPVERLHGANVRAPFHVAPPTVLSWFARSGGCESASIDTARDRALQGIRALAEISGQADAGLRGRPGTAKSGPGGRHICQATGEFPSCDDRGSASGLQPMRGIHTTARSCRIQLASAADALIRPTPRFR